MKRTEQPDIIWANHYPINTYGLTPRTIHNRPTDREKISYTRTDLYEALQSDLRTLAEFVAQSADHIERLIKTCDDHGVSETYTTKPERFLTEASAAITLAQGILEGGE